MIIKELTNEEFDDFCNNYPMSSIYQTKEYALTINKEGYSTIFVGLFDNDKIIAASLIAIESNAKFKYAYAPKGFLIDYNNYELLKTFTDLLKKYLNKKSVCAIKLCPIIIKNVYNYVLDSKIKNENFNTCFKNLEKLDYYHFGFNNNFESLKPRYDAVIDLRKDEDSLFNNIRKEFRTKIRSSEFKGIEIIEGNITSLKYLYDMSKDKYKKTYRYYENLYNYFDRTDNVDLVFAKINTKKYLEVIQKEYNEIEEKVSLFNDKIINNKEYRKIEKKLNLDIRHNELKEELNNAIKLLNENPNGIIIAGALIIRYHDTAYLEIDGYIHKYKNMNAKHLLIWKLIRRYSKSGFKKFNLGGCSNIEIDDKYIGLTKFKANFGSNIIEYIGDLELICNNTSYFMYRKAKPIKKILHKKKKEN